MTGYSSDKDALKKRLARAEGQVRGIAAMVDADRYCIDIITQIQAVRAALTNVEVELLRGHVGHCMAEAAATGDAAAREAKVSELLAVLSRLAGN